MLGSYVKKRKKSEALEFKSNKRSKPLQLELPVPTHIEITEDKKAIYHFSEVEVAKTFLHTLQNQFLLQEKDIHSVKVEVEVETGECHLNHTHLNCAYISLTSDQINAWLGREAFPKLININDFTKRNEYLRLADELEEIDSLLANQAALIVTNKRNVLTGSVDDSVPSWKIIPFLQKLNKETLLQALLYTNDGYDDAFSIIMEDLNPEAAKYLLDQLTNEDCNRLVLKKGINALSIAANQPDEIFITLVNKLSDEVLNKIAVEPDENGVGFLYYAISRFSPKIISSLIARLSAETCNIVALQRNKDNELTLERMGYWQPPEVYKLFEKKLTFDTKMQAVFPADVINEKSRARLRVVNTADKPAVKIVSTALHHPKEIKKYSQKNPQLHSIEFFDSGSSEDVWSFVTESMINAAPSVKTRRPQFDLSNALNQTPVKKVEPDFLTKLKKQNWKFLRLQGRTVLLENEKKMIRAIKIQKLNESEEALANEFKTTDYLKKNVKKLNLKSQFPEPIAVGKVFGVYKWLKNILPKEDYFKIIKLITTERNKHIYVYDVDSKNCDYFTYLHDPKISDEKFKEANRVIVNDLYTLLKFGVVFHQLADIFHNLEHTEERQDRGRYMVLVNILRNFDYRGSGRLTGWDQAVQYPNVRASGLADLGDRSSINAFIGKGEMLQNFFAETKELKGEKTANFLLANMIAEYQYILFLNAGRRGRDLTDAAKKAKLPQDEINKIWLNIAKQIMDNCIQAVAILINQKESEIAKVFSAVVDVERLGRQMQYWMTTDYITDLMNNKIKEGIYEPGTEIIVNIKNFRPGSFNPGIGCSIDGVHQDLGPVNGQEPIKEANKLFYWMVTKVFESYNLLHMTVKDLKTVTDVKDLSKSESLRAKLFTHLPNKQYHKLQHALCEERLKQKKLPKTIKKKIQTESKEHKKEYSVLTLQNFWRNHIKPQKKIDSSKEKKIGLS